MNFINGIIIGAVLGAMFGFLAAALLTGPRE